MLQIINEKSGKITSFALYKLINSCREIAGESKVRVNDFTARIADELDGDDYETFVVENPNKTKTTAFNLTIDQAYLVAMRESKAVRKAVRDKLKELSEKSFIPKNYAEALRLAADQYEVIQAQEAKLLEQQPQVEVYKLLADRKGDVSTTIIAKELGITAIKLNKFLRDNGIKWLNADLPKAGYEYWFNVVCDVKNGHEFTQCLVTPAGQIAIADLWSKA